MTDLDSRLRDLAHELVLDPPDARPFDDFGATADLGTLSEPVHGSRHRGTTRALAVAAAVVLIAVAGAAVVDRLETEPADPVPGEVCLPDPGSFTGPDGATFGPLARNNESSADKLAGSPVIRSEVPDFVRVTCTDGDGVLGWVRSTDLLPQLVGTSVDSLVVDGGPGTAMCDESGANVGTLQTSPRYPVFADDGATVVGHIYPPVGFVPLGAEPQAYPDRNGLHPCDGDVTALTTHPASSRAALDRPNAVNRDVKYDQYPNMQEDTPELEMNVYGEDYGRATYVTFADEARRLAASMARARGRPYNPADLLMPMRDEAGRIVAFLAANAGVLTPEEVRAPNFDLCQIEVGSSACRP